MFYYYSGCREAHPQVQRYHCQAFFPPGSSLGRRQWGWRSQECRRSTAYWRLSTVELIFSSQTSLNSFSEVIFSMFCVAICVDYPTRSMRNAFRS
jgi:hypothetical protein